MMRNVLIFSGVVLCLGGLLLWGRRRIFLKNGKNCYQHMGFSFAYVWTGGSFFANQENIVDAS